MREPHSSGVELDLARKVAWMYHRSSGIDHEELYSEALLAYAKALDAMRRGTFDPDRVKFTTYATTAMHNRLRSAIKQRKYQAFPFVPRDEKTPQTDREVTLLDLLDGLSEDARFAVDMVLESPLDFLSISRCAAGVRVRKALRERGVSHRKVRRVFSDIKAVLNALQGDECRQSRIWHSAGHVKGRRPRSFVGA